MTFDIRLQQNFKLFLSGPSGSGKTSLICSILANLGSFTSSPPSKVIYLYKRWQPKFDELQQLGLVHEFSRDLVNLGSRVRAQAKYESLFVIFDDLLNSDCLEDVAGLFTVDSRHLGISCAFLTQRLFVNNEFFRQISQNSDYFCLFRNPRNSSEIRTLASQVGDKRLVTIYNLATADAFGYLFINLTQSCDLRVRYMCNIFKLPHAVQIFVEDTCDD